jgi:hypothetical protein
MDNILSEILFLKSAPISRGEFRKFNSCMLILYNSKTTYIDPG